MRLALRRVSGQWQIERVDAESAYVSMLESFGPDVILCDYDMPQFSAERALQIMGERALDIPFIVVSNHIGQSDAVIAMQQGASDYLSKSDLGRLPKAIDAAMDRARTRRERAKAEEALHASEEKLRSILDSLLQRIALLDGEGTILAANRAWKAFDEDRRSIGFGEAGAGTNYLAVLDAAATRGDATAAAIASGVREVMQRRAAQFSLEYELRTGSGTRWYVARSFPLRGGDRGVVVSHRDISDRMMARIALDDANKQLQGLSRRVLSLQEEERRAISSELHDDIGQSLAALKIGLHRIAQNCGADQSGLVAECLDIAESTLDKVRGMALELHPPQLDQLGLAEALAWLAERQRTTTGVDIEVQCAGLEGRRPSRSLENACYRIAQEAINNATRHGKATHIMVSVEAGSPLLKLTIRDDGVGFDEEAARLKALKSGSLGLISMEERARLAGGRLKFRSVRGGGTTIGAIFPLQPSAATTAMPDLPLPEA